MLGLGGEEGNGMFYKRRNMYKMYKLYELKSMEIDFKLLVLVKKYTKVIYRQSETQCLLVREYVVNTKEWEIDKLKVPGNKYSSKVRNWRTKERKETMEFVLRKQNTSQKASYEYRDG